jgi:hypothetical protein
MRSAEGVKTVPVLFLYIMLRTGLPPAATIAGLSPLSIDEAYSALRHAWNASPRFGPPRATDLGLATPGNGTDARIISPSDERCGRSVR